MGGGGMIRGEGKEGGIMGRGDMMRRGDMIG